MPTMEIESYPTIYQAMRNMVLDNDILNSRITMNFVARHMSEKLSKEYAEGQLDRFEKELARLNKLQLDELTMGEMGAIVKMEHVSEECLDLIVFIFNNFRGVIEYDKKRTYR